MSNPISVKDKLPTPSWKDVLAYTSCGWTRAHYCPGWDQWRDEDDDLIEEEVTYWMPLPPDPEEGNR